MSTSISLSGRRIAVTRAREQSPELTARLMTHGADVIELPLITVSKEIDLETLHDVLSELASYDWIVFTSANGVRFFFDEFYRIYDDVRALGMLRFAAIGDTTAKPIAEQHIKVECQPKVATADALAEALIATGSLDSAKVLVITGNLNREDLVKRLEDGRAIVDCLQVYKTEKTDLAAEPAAAVTWPVSIGHSCRRRARPPTSSACERGSAPSSAASWTPALSWLVCCPACSFGRLLRAFRSRSPGAR